MKSIEKKYYWKNGSITTKLINDVLHRENGPAVEGHDSTHWEFVYNGQFHNINGPSICWKDGTLFYHIGGEYIGINLSNAEFKQKVKEFVFK